MRAEVEYIGNPDAGYGPAAWFTHMRGWEEELLLYVSNDFAVAWVVAHGPHTLFWQDASYPCVFGMNGRVRQENEAWSELKTSGLLLWLLSRLL
jgi:hypothetical protein